MLCHAFRQDPHRPFFVPDRRAATRELPKAPTDQRAALRAQVIELRKRNFSIYDIVRGLHEQGQTLSAPAVWAILNEEGFSKLPRRRDEERPVNARPEAALAADARAVNWEEREFRTEFGGLFLFLPMLAELGFDALMRKAGLPGTKMIPAPCAMRSLLGLKLFGNARHSHVMSAVFDEGLALFAGLNVIPKGSFLTEYSCRIEPECYPKLMRGWFDAMTGVGLKRGESFHLDFHSIPFHGEQALVEKHYVSKRSRRQKGILAFLAQDAQNNVFCYANADLRKQDQDDEILRFVQFWKKRTGALPEELIFDSRLTTYANLDALNRMGIRFITLRRRTQKLLESIDLAPPSAWRRVQLKSPSRIHRTPRVLDQRIRLDHYEGELRQLVIAELGHEQPTLLITNQLRRSAPDLIDHYARRMLIENTISDSVDFFHIDALSSAVALKINCDLQLTLMGSSLYRMLGARIGGAYASAESRHLFRDFIEASARVCIGPKTVEVHFGKRAHNPLLLAAGFQNTDVAIPWWNGRRLQLLFG